MFVTWKFPALSGFKPYPNQGSAHAVAGEDGKYSMSRREEKHMETHTKFATNPYPSIYTEQWAYLTDTVVCITAS